MGLKAVVASIQVKLCVFMISVEEVLIIDMNNLMKRVNLLGICSCQFLEIKSQYSCERQLADYRSDNQTG